MDYPQENELHILLGVTGSVAAVKAPEIAIRLVEELVSESDSLAVRVRVLFTDAGKHFWQKGAEYDSFTWERMLAHNNRKKAPVIETFDSDDEWNQWDRLGDPVLHIDLREWADILVVAPLSANTLAKFANGLCDNILTCVARAWKFQSFAAEKTFEDDAYHSKPIILAPAMNTAMWEHPLTNQQIDTFKSFSSNIVFVQPQSKQLACREIGNGALAPIEDIINEVKKALVQYQNVKIAEKNKLEEMKPRDPSHCPS